MKNEYIYFKKNYYCERGGYEPRTIVFASDRCISVCEGEKSGKDIKCG